MKRTFKALVVGWKPDGEWAGWRDYKLTELSAPYDDMIYDAFLNRVRLSLCHVEGDEDYSPELDLGDVVTVTIEIPEKS